MVGGGNGSVLTFARKGPVASNRHRDGVLGGWMSERVVGIARGKPQLAATDSVYISRVATL